MFPLPKENFSLLINQCKWAFTGKWTGNVSRTQDIMLHQGIPCPLFILKWKFFLNAEKLDLDWLRKSSQIVEEQVLFCKLRTLFPSLLLLQLICVQSGGNSYQANDWDGAIYEIRYSLQSNTTSSLFLFIFPSLTSSIIVQLRTDINIDQNRNTARSLLGLAWLQLTSPQCLSWCTG